MEPYGQPLGRSRELYRVAPKATARVANVAEWVRGEDLVFVSAYPEPPVDPEFPFQDPARGLHPIRYMPEEGARRAASAISTF